MRPIDEIVVHCSATRREWMSEFPLSAQVDEIRRWHVAGNGWSDIGYHFLIGRDGAVLPGRPLDKVGAHVRGHNTGTIGVCLIGGHGSSADDAFSDHFTEAQETTLRTLIGCLDAVIGKPLKVTGHNDYAAKACPGFRVSGFL